MLHFVQPMFFFSQRRRGAARPNTRVVVLVRRILIAFNLIPGTATILLPECAQYFTFGKTNLPDYMIDESPKRFDRIVAILIQLQSKRIVKAQDLADRFQVSLRTIYRDIRTLESSGVPILSEAGTGYSIMDGYKLPPVMFTREEAGSFVAAEKLMQKFTDKALGDNFRSAVYKVKSVLRSKEKDWISTLESQIMVNSSREPFSESVPDALEIIMEGIAERRQVALLYQAFDADTPTPRMIEAVGLFHENNCWYIMGYCHLREDYRQFRTDRITGISRTDKPYTRQHGNIDQYRKREPLRNAATIKILVEKKVARYIQHGRKYYGYISEREVDGCIEMTFELCESDTGFARWFLMFGDRAEILEPQSLKEQVRDLLLKTLTRLGLPETELADAIGR
jgi:predicted DNA-binding transcriptional regulator YafY